MATGEFGEVSGWVYSKYYQSPEECQSTNLGTQTPTIDCAKKWKEDFVERDKQDKQIDRAVLIGAIVLSAIALVVLVTLTVYGFSNCQYETYQALCNCCGEVHNMTRCLTPGMEMLALFGGVGSILSLATGLVSSFCWLGATFEKRHAETKKPA